MKLVKKLLWIFCTNELIKPKLDTNQKHSCRLINQAAKNNYGCLQKQNTNSFTVQKFGKKGNKSLEHK